MKYIEPIKLVIGLVLISIGIYFGFKLMVVSYGAIGTLPSLGVIGDSGNIVATYTPIYAGMALLSGVYLLTKVNR